jgi:hypothetical protein
VGLKGRVTPADLAATLNDDPNNVQAAIADLVESGLLGQGKMLRITPEGRDHLDRLLAEERAGVDKLAVAASYRGFRTVNAEFKVVVADWQLKGGLPNAHDDSAYDSAVLARLHDVHERVVQIMTAVAQQLPRLARYTDKLAAALAKVDDGDTTWFTRPIVDSYHTVWFELHEELIVASGLSRAEEAKAGHAQ